MYKCKYCNKEFEKKQQLAGHVIWCKDNPNKTGKSNFSNIQRTQDIIQDNLFCKYCGKQCKNKNSLVQHEIRCKENPNKIDITNSCKNIVLFNGENKTRSNQFIKAKINNLPAPKVSKETKRKISDGQRGRKHTLETKRKQREGLIRYKQTLYNTNIFANYNKAGCEFINQLNENNGWNLQHAENGGEIQVAGYFLDGYDKELNIAFEYDEPKHYEDVENNILKQRDIERQNYIIEKLHCRFFRYNEKLDLLYEVKI